MPPWVDIMQLGNVQLKRGEGSAFDASSPFFLSLGHPDLKHLSG
jgi:hypothetical protein